ncbi:hypothetical protein CCAX7_31430 [Capsulimonas corticalis]|uniref:Uncharacterized protein n=1 Tax=Capsulimonas corticalis TaxID=2219043 RepID=A0A402CSG5_9BACT|nr:hypothetical protein [Capsulimonas corticalis]BDI31092.1 hypothetical protein CCAX7_31430 [Capsulimonas corticalis]
MGAAFYVVLEREIEDFDSSMNGKPLGHLPYDENDVDILTSIAKTIGVKSLMEYSSADPDQIIGMIFDGDPAEAPLELRNRIPPTEWFAAEDGLAAARALLHYLQAHPDFIPTPEDISWNFQESVEADLQDLERILERAQQEGVRWYLGGDC